MCSSKFAGWYVETGHQRAVAKNYATQPKSTEQLVNQNNFKYGNHQTEMDYTVN